MATPTVDFPLPPLQQTLARSVTFEGVGLHTGAPARVTVHPAPADHGLVFQVGDVRIPALAEFVTDTSRCTVLSHQGAQVSTVEHLLAALSGYWIDNALIRVEGPELPIMDGSALPFAHAIAETGIAPQDAPARWIHLPEPVWAPAGDKQVLALPAERLTVAAAVDFERPMAGPQVFAFSPTEPEQFARDLAPARTFCFEEWIAAILAAGLGGGGSVENVLVLSDTGTSTPMRFPDELARHKALDLLGDLALVGGRLCAHVIAVKAGHALHVAAAAHIRRFAHA